MTSLHRCLSSCFLATLVKREPPASLPTFHHQTANASTNTPINEHNSFSPFYMSSATNKSPSTDLSTALAPMKLSNVSSFSSSFVASGNSSNNTSNKLTKISSNTHQQEYPSFSFNVRSDTNQDSISHLDKKASVVSYPRFREQHEQHDSLLIRRIPLDPPRTHLDPVVSSFLIKPRFYFSPTMQLIWRFSKPSIVCSVNVVSLGSELNCMQFQQRIR